MLGSSFEDNEGVIGILQDRARKGGGERVFKRPIAGRQKDKTLEGVSNKDEEVGRERVSLSEAMTALDPITWLAVEEDGRLTGKEERNHPLSPEGRKALSIEYKIEGRTADRVKSFAEIEL